MDAVRLYTNPVTDRLPEPVLTLDHSGIITYINPAGSTLLNVQAGEPFPGNSHSFTASCREAVQTAAPVNFLYVVPATQEQRMLTIVPAGDELFILFAPAARNPAVPTVTESNQDLSGQVLAETIINYLPGIFYLSDATPRLRRWNNALENISGYNTAELSAMVPIDLFDSRDHPAFKTAMAQALTEGSASIETRLVSKDGNSIPFYFTGVRIQYNGKPALLGMGIDITTQQKALDALRVSAERYDLTARATNDMIWDWNLLTDEIWWNENYLALFGGHTNPDINHIESWKKSIHSEDRERVVNGIYKVIQSGQVFWTAEYRCIAASGSVVHIYDRGYVMHDAKGKPFRMIGSMLDITARIKTEQALRENESKYRNLFQGASDSIILHDLAGNIVDMNAAASDFSGYSTAELLRKKITDLLFAEDLPGNPLPLDRLEKGETTYNRRRIKTKSGITRVMDLSSRMLPDRTIMAILRDVTERSAAENALRNSEIRFRALAEHAPVGIFETDAAGNTTYVNQKMCAYTGLSFDELLNNNWTQCIHPDDRNSVIRQWDKHLSAHSESSQQYRIVAKDGSIHWIQGKAIPLKDKNGAFSGYLGTITDITVEQLALLALSESEEKYRTLVEQASDAIYIVDEKGDLVTVNPAACHLSGYTEKTLLGMNIMDFIFPEDLDTNPFRFDELRSGKTVTIQRRFRISGNRELNVECLANMLSDGRILVFARDITERLAAEKALRESEEKYRTLVEQASDGIYITDSEGRILSANSSTARLSQYSEAEMLQMTIYDLVDPDDLAKQPFRFEELRQGKTVVSERRMRQKSGKLLQIENTTKMLSDGRILIFVRDISERIRAREELLREKKLSDSLINSLPGIFYLFDEAGHFIRWNKNFEFITGYTESEIAGMHPVHFFDEANRSIILDKMAEAFRTGQTEVELPITTKNGERIPYYLTGWRVIVENKPCLIGVGIDISEKKKAEVLLRQSYDDIRRLASHLTRVREEERKRIGREIHDELGQQLTAIKMDMAWIEKRLGEDALIKSKIRNVITLLDSGNKSVRRILTELSPGVNDNNGLIESLERLNLQFESSSGIPVQFSADTDKLTLPQETANCIYRVYQESLTNIMKHASASEVTARLESTGGIIQVLIRDNGKGFDKQKGKKITSFGLLGMQERVLSFHGNFSVDAAPGKGTTITFSIPADNQKTEHRE